jgi:ATP-binding cassette subfamily B protein RaxB
MGSSLSGGQRQRILLARALYRQPTILILDEGTANLDERTEEVVADLIESLPITRVVVAHRPALVRRAAKVIELDGGVAREIPGREPAPRAMNA